jgi:RNase P subunit RPR2
MARVARVWKISRANVYRSLKETPPNTIAGRPGPVGAWSDAELADHIRQHIADSRLHDEGYRKLCRGCALLAFAPQGYSVLWRLRSQKTNEALPQTDEACFVCGSDRQFMTSSGRLR